MQPLPTVIVCRHQYGLRPACHVALQTGLVLNMGRGVLCCITGGMSHETLLAQAYSVLSNPAERQHYNARLQEQLQDALDDFTGVLCIRQM